MLLRMIIEFAAYKTINLLLALLLKVVPALQISTTSAAAALPLLWPPTLLSLPLGWSRRDNQPIMQAATSGPRFLDSEIAAKLKDATTKKYRAAVSQFLGFITDFGFCISCAAELDDLLVEWKHCRRIKKNLFQEAIAGVEFVLPHWE